MKRVFLLSILIINALASAPAQTQDAINKFRLAQSFEQAGEFDRASRLYEDLISADSLNYSYFDGLRRCYEQLKNYGAAIALSSKRLGQQPSDINTMAALGGIYYKSGDEVRADSVWNEVILRFPSGAISYRIVAAAQSDNRLFDKSIRTYLRGRNELGEPALFVGELSALYALMMDYAAATREYITMLSMNEHQLDFIESRLSMFTSKADGLSPATKATEEAVLRQGRSVVLRRLLLWLYLEGKQFGRAYDVAEDLERTINSNGTEMLQFGDRAFKEKAYDVAAKAYQFSLEKNPGIAHVPLARYGYARAVEELNAVNDTVPSTKSMTNIHPSETQPGYQGAMALFLSLAREYPNSEISVQCLYRVGLIRYQRYFDLDGAVQVLDSSLSLPVARMLAPGILATAAEINVAQGALDKASDRYARVFSSQVAATAQKAQAQFRLAEIEYFRGDFDSAVSILGQLTQVLAADESNDALLLLHFVKENQSDFGEALKAYAHSELLQRQKKSSEAIALLSSTIQAFSEAPLVDDALLLKAQLLIDVGQSGDALLSYQKLLADYPKSILKDKAQFGLGELYQLHLKNKEKAIQAYEEVLSAFPQSLFVEEARKRIRMLRGDAL